MEWVCRCTVLRRKKSALVKRWQTHPNMLVGKKLLWYSVLFLLLNKDAEGHLSQSFTMQKVRLSLACVDVMANSVHISSSV